MVQLETHLSQFYLTVGWQPFTWFGLFLAATIGDGMATIYGLNHGAREANPVMKWAMDKTSPVIAITVIKKVQVGAVFSVLQPAILYMPLVVAFYAGICLNNARVVWMAR